MARIKINDLSSDERLTNDEMRAVLGGRLPQISSVNLSPGSTVYIAPLPSPLPNPNIGMAAPLPSPIPDPNRISIAPLPTP